VKNRFQNVPFKFNLRRYNEGDGIIIGAGDGSVIHFAADSVRAAVGRCTLNSV
jgi:hypothetical protein